jgi:uncharacterized membrane protein YcaP (DUF421 family)
LRAAAVYGLSLVLVRISGRRTLASMTSFDFILLLIISEATQNALLGDDRSMTGAFLVIATLVALDIGLALLKQRSPWLEKWVEGLPTVLIEDGRPLEDRMDMARVDVADIMQAARELQGVERMDQIKFAVLERNGTITIIPKQK